MMPVSSRISLLMVAASLLAACSKVADQPVLAIQACSIDAIDGVSGTPPSAAIGTKLVVRGWAADTIGKRVGDRIFVRLVNDAGSVVASGERSATVPRPDVAKHFNLAQVTGSGFHAEIDTKGLAAGRHEIFIESRFKDLAVACRPERPITLK